MRRLVLAPEISRMIGKCGLTRPGILRLLTRLHQDLPQRYLNYSGLRHPEDDRLFRYLDSLADAGLLHTFVFAVDDATSPDHLIVVDLSHESRPLP